MICLTNTHTHGLRKKNLELIFYVFCQNKILVANWNLDVTSSTRIIPKFGKIDLRRHLADRFTPRIELFGIPRSQSFLKWLWNRFCKTFATVILDAT